MDSGTREDGHAVVPVRRGEPVRHRLADPAGGVVGEALRQGEEVETRGLVGGQDEVAEAAGRSGAPTPPGGGTGGGCGQSLEGTGEHGTARSEEHTSELQS